MNDGTWYRMARWYDVLKDDLIMRPINLRSNDVGVKSRPDDVAC